VQLRQPTAKFSPCTCLFGVQIPSGEDGGGEAVEMLVFGFEVEFVL
jgi:hypothetical protein